MPTSVLGVFCLNYDAPVSTVVVVYSAVRSSDYSTAPDYPILPPIPG